MARGKVQGYVEQGGNTVSTGGLVSTTSVQKSFPGATVTVYAAGTTNTVSIYSDSGGTPKANPFTADSSGFWFFYTDTSTVDVKFSGTGITTPWTLAGISVSVSTGSTVDVSLLATGGVGTSGNPWTGWETALNAVAVDTRVYFPAGYYTQTTKIEVHLGQLVYGDGKDSTIIQSSFVGTAFRIDAVPANPFAVLQHGNISIRDLQIKNTHVANTGSGILAVSVTYCDFTSVKIVGFKSGVTYINCHSMVLRGPSYFSGQITMGAWLVNDGSYKAANGWDIDYSAYAGGGTNDIVIDDYTIFNESATCYGVVDDGGQGRKFTIGLNGCSSGLRLAGTAENSIKCHSEACTNSIVLLDFQRLYGGVGGGAAVQFDSAYFAPAAGQACITASSCTLLVLIGTTFNTSTTAISGGNTINTVVNIGSKPANASLLGASFPTRLIDLASDNRFTLRGIPLVFGTGGLSLVGSAALTGGTVVVTSTSVTANSIVFVNRKTVGGTAGALSYTVAAGANFTINSASTADTSTVDWLMVEKS